MVQLCLQEGCAGLQLGRNFVHATSTLPGSHKAKESLTSVGMLHAALVPSVWLNYHGIIL